MANASVDENGNQTITARLNSDGVTITRVKVNATNHGIKVSDGTGGSDKGGVNAAIDDNERPTWIAVSNIDGKTLVALYADSSGNLLVKST